VVRFSGVHSRKILLQNTPSQDVWCNCSAWQSERGFVPNVVMTISLEWLGESPEEVEGCTLAKEYKKHAMFQSMKTGCTTYIQEVHGFLIG